MERLSDRFWLHMLFFLAVLAGVVNFVSPSTPASETEQPVGPPPVFGPLFIPLPTISTAPTTTNKISEATSSKPKTIKPVAVKSATTSPPTITEPKQTNISAPPPPNAGELNLKTRESVVNILCTTKTGGFFEPISGSGVIIDPRGIILTNAHVAQFFLLKDFQVPDFIDCTIRTGSPASPSYRAALIYISPRWIRANAEKINLSRSPGTGENDFALLRITGSVKESTALPPRFTYSVPDPTFESFFPQNPVLLVSYPAELLGGILTQTSLNQVSSLGTIKKGFFFIGHTLGMLDIFSLGGNITAQGGSSGGAVIDSLTGKLIGILVTSTVAASTDEKNLTSLSLSHINRGLEEETGQNLGTFIGPDPSILQQNFERSAFQEMKNILVNAIDHN